MAASDKEEVKNNAELPQTQRGKRLSKVSNAGYQTDYSVALERIFVILCDVNFDG